MDLVASLYPLAAVLGAVVGGAGLHRLLRAVLWDLVLKRAGVGQDARRKIVVSAARRDLTGREEVTSAKLTRRHPDSSSRRTLGSAAAPR